MRRPAAIALVLLAACGGSGDRVIVGAGTTLVDSGFVELVVASYEEETGAQVSVIGESSQRLLDLARRGEIDLLLTHEPDALEAFIAQGYADRSRPIFRSTFLIAGPPGLAAQITAGTVVDAFSAIAEGGFPFVGRADGSGTSRQEQVAWELAGIDPAGEPWYDTTGQGMGLTLQVASQRGAFVFVEEGSWVAARGQLDLVELALEEAWPNPYFATVVAGGAPAAVGLFEWLAEPSGEAAIAAANRELFGRDVYRPFRP